jgi:hypothetical protein
MKEGFRILMMTLFCMVCLSGTAQTFKFRQVHADDTCLVQLMENIAKVIHNSNHFHDAKCHFLSIKVEGVDSMLEIHSFDYPGIYNTLSKRELYGVCIIFDHEFYIDTSLAALFYYSGDSFKKKYKRKLVDANRFTINDCYYYWLFKKEICGIDLCGFSYIGNFKDWYNLDLDSDCFCDYKKLTIDIIEEEPEILEEN